MNLCIHQALRHPVQSSCYDVNFAGVVSVMTMAGHDITVLEKLPAIFSAVLAISVFVH